MSQIVASCAKGQIGFRSCPLDAPTFRTFAASREPIPLFQSVPNIVAISCEGAKMKPPQSADLADEPHSIDWSQSCFLGAKERVLAWIRLDQASPAAKNDSTCVRGGRLLAGSDQWRYDSKAGRVCSMKLNRFIGVVGIPVLLAATVAPRTENLLLVHINPDYGTINSGDLKIAQSCKDEVEVGNKYKTQPDRHAQKYDSKNPASRKLQLIIFNINNCLEAQNLGLHVFASSEYLKNPMLH
jgi:hypothetical protein